MGKPIGKPWENHRKTIGKWKFIGAFYVGLLDGLLGVAGILTSDEMDHSRKFPTFSTSKSKSPCVSEFGGTNVLFSAKC